MARKFPDVDIASQKDIGRGVDRALTRLDMTIEDLSAQARTGSFSSEQARLLWLEVAPSGQRGQGC